MHLCAHCHRDLTYITTYKIRIGSRKITICRTCAADLNDARLNFVIAQKEANHTTGE